MVGIENWEWELEWEWKNVGSLRLGLDECTRGSKKEGTDLSVVEKQRR